MLKSTVLAILIASAAAPASACMVEKPESFETHQREIYILDQGIEKSTRDAGVLAKAKELRAQADAAFKAGKVHKALEYRRSALIQIGYKVEVPPAPVASKGPPANGQVLRSRGCGGEGTVWVPPSE